MSPCEKIARSEQPTAFIRTRTPVEELPEVMDSAYKTIASVISKQRSSPAGPPYAAYHNMDMSDLDVEIGFPLAEPFSREDDVQAGSIPAGSYAACLYTGPYSGIEKGYKALTAWIKGQGLKPTGVSFEFYLNDPDDTSPEKLLTQILFPLV